MSLIDDEERAIRLECLTLAQSASGLAESADAAEVVRRAQAYADFVLCGKAAPNEEPPAGDEVKALGASVRAAIEDGVRKALSHSRGIVGHGCL